MFGKENGPRTMNFARKRDNIYRAFGTQDLVRILSPSLRTVPFSGLEWSFLFKDEGLDYKGYKYDPFAEATSNTDDG